MDNIITVLDAAGATLEDLVKCTVFLADIDDYAAMNAVYVEYFPSDPPARSAVAGGGLALGALVEIECIAAVPEGGRARGGNYLPSGRPPSTGMTIPVTKVSSVAVASTARPTSSGVASRPSGVCSIMC